MSDDRMRTQIERAASAIVASSYAIALVGAGISVESGIPPFRGKGGLWTKHGEPAMDGYRRFLADPVTYWESLLARRESDDEFARALRAAEPNAGHRALAELEELGYLKHVITQNIDNLHFAAGSRSVTEIHGNRTKLRCIECGNRWSFADFAMAELPPRCPDCAGIVKGDTVMFGETIPEQALRACYEQSGRADCMLIVGTSAEVTPAAWFPGMVLDRGGTIVEVNIEETPYSSQAAALLRGPAGELLPQLIARVRELHQELKPAQNRSAADD